MRIIQDISLHGEGTKEIPLGVKLSEMEGNQLWLLEDGLFLGDLNKPYIPPTITLTGDPDEDMYEEKIDKLILYVHITRGSKPLQNISIIDNNGYIVHEFTNIPDEPVFTLEYTLPNGLENNTSFQAVVSDGQEYHSQTLSYTFGDPDISIGNPKPDASNEYAGGVCIGAGLVVAIPNYAEQFAMVDPENLTAKVFGMQLDDPQTVDHGKFVGGIYIGDGKLVAIPYSAPQPILVDATKFKKTKNLDDITLTFFGEKDTSASKYSGGAFMGSEITNNGIEYHVLAFASSQKPAIIKVNIDNNQNVTGSVTPFGNIYVDVNEYRGGVRMGDDGKFLMIPFNQGINFKIVDPLADEASKITKIGEPFYGYSRFAYAVYIDEQRALANPHDEKYFHVIDMNKNPIGVTAVSNYEKPANKFWRGGIYLGKNKILLCPMKDTKFAVLTITINETTVTCTIEEIGNIKAENKIYWFMGATYAGNGKVVAIACNAPQFAYIDLNVCGIKHDLPDEMTEEHLLSPYFNKAF